MSASIHRRLLARLSLSLIALAALIAALLYGAVWRTAQGAFDRALVGAALAIADRVVVEQGALSVDLPYVALEMLSASADERVYYRIDERDGRSVTGYADLPEPGDGGDDLRPWRASAVDAQWFYDTRYLGQSVRVAVLSRVALGGPAPRRFTVFVAETDNGRRALGRRLLLVFGGGMALLSLCVLGAVWWSLRTGLAPLGRFSRALGVRGVDDLDPLSLSLPAELDPVGRAIDTLLARVKRSQLELTRFVEDASHQLRTPLAALQAQLELAVSQDDPARRTAELQSAQRTLSRSIRLSQQLLSHARSAEPQRREALDLAALTAATCREWVPAALRAAQDLGYQGPEQGLHFVGDKLMLQEMLRNLIDNAICYAPSGSAITAALTPDGEGLVLSVEDDGPVIPAEWRERLFDRFFRPAGSGGSGSGLGLAIVRSIARSHGGEASYRAPADGGNRFEVRVPLSGASGSDAAESADGQPAAGGGSAPDGKPLAGTRSQ